MKPDRLTIRRFWTRVGQSPYNEIHWVRRDAQILGRKGEVVFARAAVEVPSGWSEMAAAVATSKYMRAPSPGLVGEYSVRQLVKRVVDTLTDWGRRGEYFASEADALAFNDELAYMLLYQIGAFNSPVWFNVGVEEQPQCSACFINSVGDSMESILDLAKVEGMLFKYGSGSGSNLSPLRGRSEPLSGGGTASGPVSFMRGFDAFAGVIKSGGRTRRAAKMVILDVDHPDIHEFISCKALEERKAVALIEAGYDPSLDGEAYRSVFFQNANHSVRVPDAFMEAALEGGEWQTHNRVDGAVAQRFPAADLLQTMAEAAHTCGDPGLQFDTTINRWHTCKKAGRINASNPCSEYMFLDDTACNLASLNLMRLRARDGSMDIDLFCHAVRVFFTAMDIIVDNASYPTPRIAETSRRFRPLGLGYTNLGALLMARGMAYDSDDARIFAAALTALMTGEAYAQSARLAAAKGVFEAYPDNQASMAGVMSLHRSALDKIPPGESSELCDAARASWKECLKLGELYGYRNAQATAIAPTGTISFMMDCDTTGIEPELALVKSKDLVGGGRLTLPNQVLSESLSTLGYGTDAREAILDYVEKHGGIEGAPGLAKQHVSVFDCAFSPWPGGRSILPGAHIRMMAAVQPFVSGAISKTVNLPSSAGVEDIRKLFVEAWSSGLKSIAVYRDGCKAHQPLSAVGDRPPSGPDCGECGHGMHLTGACYVCERCGATLGCA